ncbi:MAG: helix-turn-helix transcriptional regulator [Lachnospiraceae bacterium]|nr:helix-turn-helix transcriptional regulator [Lachnospiraceae bacterium]
MTLAEKLNKIIAEQNISKREFARRLGISENYLYILTGNSRPGTNKNKTISPALAKLIALEFGYEVDWIMEKPKKTE